jgi:hypothetical protein
MSSNVIDTLAYIKSLRKLEELLSSKSDSDV